MPSLSVNGVAGDMDARHDGEVEDGPQPLAYCITANIADETTQGDGGLEIRAGLKHFAPGAKVWILPPQWGDGGEKVMVAGRHRGAAGPYIRIVVPRRHLTSFRVRAVYSPALLRALTKPWKGLEYGPSLWETLQQAERSASQWQERTIEARFDDETRSVDVIDPPPLDLQHNGKTYYLAHFNARRALYSSQPPPIEHPPVS
jgi:hypothetical protein